MQLVFIGVLNNSIIAVWSERDALLDHFVDTVPFSLTTVPEQQSAQVAVEAADSRPLIGHCGRQAWMNLNERIEKYLTPHPCASQC